MIIQSLRLENFGVYAGAHEIDLTPSSRDKPIILFGGLNGGGKTTLLDAIQLALFGKLSRCSTRGNMAYEDFLQRSISHAAADGATAAVELSIRQSFDAKVQDFVVRREWAHTEGRTVEKLTIERDGTADSELAENWLEHVDQFIPIGLAELFFFDGEQIARLAEAENAANMLATAINTLLGIDLVDRLERDLLTYERDVSKQEKGDEINPEIAVRESKVELLNQELQRLTLERAELQSRSDSLIKRVEEQAQIFKKQGGELYQRRQQLVADRDKASHRLQSLEAEMRRLAEGHLPLVLVQDKLDLICRQAGLEERAIRGRLLLEELKTRDRAVLNLVRSKGSHDLHKAISVFLDRDRDRRSAAASVEPYLNLDRNAAQQVNTAASVLGDSLKSTRRLLAAHKEAATQIQKLDDLLERVPDDGAIAQASENLKNAEKELSESRTAITAATNVLGSLSKQIDDEQRALAKILERNAEAAAANDDVKRKLRFAARARDTMKQFRGKILSRKINQIERAILDSLRQLLRKKDFIANIRINPDTYQMTLLGANGREIHGDRLSAGERQLLAVATLWGLARASGRPLPTIIDTPLGRLDSKHRANLVEHYFPNASHQVIVLSTDEEINATHFAKLRSRISRSFEISFSPSAKSATIERGYFFN